MKIVILILPLVLFSGCEESNDPRVYTSIEGKWRYTTPAEDMRVEFEIDKVNEEYKIKKGTIFIEGKKMNVKIGEDNILVSEVTEGLIHSIYLMDENSSGIAILFQSVLRNEFYTELTAGQVDYSPSPGEFINLQFQAITR